VSNDHTFYASNTITAVAPDGTGKKTHPIEGLHLGNFSDFVTDASHYALQL
jgi:hypothetical protein